MNIYLAGPFFNEKELEAVKRAEELIGARNDLYLYSPRRHEQQSQSGTRQWSMDVFENVRSAIDRCDCVVMLYHGQYSDSGTAWECGYAYGIGKPVVVVQLREDSNLMVHEGSSTNITMEDLATYDFEGMPRNVYQGVIV